MKVKRLIEILQSMPQEATIQINIRQSTCYIDILRVNAYKTKVLNKPVDKVEIVGDWRDFELDEKEDELCQQELDEENRPEQDGHDDNADELHDAIIDHELTFGK